jgi:1,4-alpha-glucan branching enzyme
MPRITGGKPTEFRLYAPSAKKVSLAGSFNNWDTKKFSGKKDTKGNWSIKVDLKPGRHEYKFFVDGSWWNDPQCTSCVPNGFGSNNCIIDVK